MCLMSFLCICLHGIIFCRNSNINGEDSCKKSYRGKSGGRRGEGSFRPVTVDEMNSLIGLLIYMGLVKVYYNKIFSVLFLILCICRFLSSQITGSQLFSFTGCGPEGSCLAIVLTRSYWSYRWKILVLIRTKRLTH